MFLSACNVDFYVFFSLCTESSTLHNVSCSCALVLTVERDDIQQHGALPLVGGPLQLCRGVDPDCGGWVLQSGQQLVLAQSSVLPRTVVRHVSAQRTHITHAAKV